MNLLGMKRFTLGIAFWAPVVAHTIPLVDPFFSAAALIVVFVPG